MKFIKDQCKVLCFCLENQLHTYRINKNDNKILNNHQFSIQ